VLISDAAGLVLNQKTETKSKLYAASSVFNQKRKPNQNSTVSVFGKGNFYKT